MRCLSFSSFTFFVDQSFVEVSTGSGINLCPAKRMVSAKSGLEDELLLKQIQRVVKFFLRLVDRFSILLTGAAIDVT